MYSFMWENFNSEFMLAHKYWWTFKLFLLKINLAISNLQKRVGICPPNLLGKQMIDQIFFEYRDKYFDCTVAYI